MRSALALACCIVLVGSAAAHPPPRTGSRELVRLQGHPGMVTPLSTVRPLALVALGVERPFAASDVRTFSLGDVPPVTPAPGTRFVLQGPRELLARYAAARPEQTVTILAEHRPGSSDLFVLTLDLCPSR
jgi:hypothetical protein